MINETERSLSPLFVQWNHVDGPLLICRNGKMHWLTLGERLRLWLGWITLYQIERKWMHRNDDF